MREPGMLNGCRVVLTRPAEQAEELAGPLRRLGAEVRVRPLVGIAPPADPRLLRDVLAQVGSYDRVLFTSGNAIRACVREAPAAVRWPAAACVGPGTMRVAVAAGLPVDVVPAESYSAEGLAAALEARTAVRGRRMLWPRASGAREELGVRLRAGGAVVDEIECYRTVPDPEAARALREELRSEPADLLVFTAPSAVHTLAEAAGPDPAEAIAVIGTSTAAAVARVGWRVAVIPAQQSLPGLLSAVAEWWAGRAG